MATSRKIALLFAAENINAIFGWIALLFVARKMGASALGEFSYALSLVGSFTFIAFFGFGMAHIKRISEGSDLGKCIGTFLSIRFFLTALMLFIFIISYWYWTSVLDKDIYDIQTPDLLLTVVLYYVFFLLINVMPTTFSGLEQSAKVAIPNIIGTTVRSLIFITASLMGLGVIWLARGYLIGILVIGILSLWYFRNLPISKPDKITFNSYKTYALPVALASIFGVLRQYIDKMFIGLFWTEYQVGLYFGVQRIAIFIGTMALAIEGMLLPAISSLHSKSENNKIKDLVYDTEKYISMVCVPLVFMTVVWSSEIILIFISREFLEATKILKILAIVALIRVLNRPWSVALRGSDRPDLTSILSVFIGILTIILMLLLIPKNIPHLGLENLGGLGGEGAAYAILLSELVGSLILRFLCYKYLGIIPRFNFILQIMIGFFVAAIMWQVQLATTVDRWFELFTFSVFGGLLFISILAATGLFTQKDYNFFWNTLNPKSMKDYIGEELRR